MLPSDPGALLDLLRSLFRIVFLPLPEIDQQLPGEKKKGEKRSFAGVRLVVELRL